jgi:hypothetical protein
MHTPSEVLQPELIPVDLLRGSETSRGTRGCFTCQLNQSSEGFSILLILQYGLSESSEPTHMRLS